MHTRPSPWAPVRAKKYEKYKCEKWFAIGRVFLHSRFWKTLLKYFWGTTLKPTESLLAPKWNRRSTFRGQALTRDQICTYVGLTRVESVWQVLEYLFISNLTLKSFRLNYSVFHGIGNQGQGCCEFVLGFPGWWLRREMTLGIAILFFPCPVPVCHREK